MLRIFKQFKGTADLPCTTGEMFLVGQSVGAMSGAIVNPVEVLKIRLVFSFHQLKSSLFQQ